RAAKKGRPVEGLDCGSADPPSVSIVLFYSRKAQSLLARARVLGTPSFQPQGGGGGGGGGGSIFFRPLVFSPPVVVAWVVVSCVAVSVFRHPPPRLPRTRKAATPAKPRKRISAPLRRARKARRKTPRPAPGGSRPHGGTHPHRCQPRCTLLAERVPIDGPAVLRPGCVDEVVEPRGRRDLPPGDGPHRPVTKREIHNARMPAAEGVPLGVARVWQPVGGRHAPRPHPAPPVRTRPRLAAPT